jgi:hypothetical protein
VKYRYPMWIRLCLEYPGFTGINLQRELSHAGFTISVS